jgi:hypothetical protein
MPELEIFLSLGEVALARRCAKRVLEMDRAKLSKAQLDEMNGLMETYDELIEQYLRNQALTRGGYKLTLDASFLTPVSPKAKEDPIVQKEEPREVFIAPEEEGESE